MDMGAIWFVRIGLLLIGLNCCVVTPIWSGGRDDLMASIGQLSLEDVTSINRRIQGVIGDSAESTGYADPWPVGGSGQVMILFPGDGINNANSTQSGSVTYLVGGAGGFVVNLSREWAIGGLFGAMGGYSSRYLLDQYHDYAVGASFQMIQCRFKPMITSKWIIDITGGIGILSGGYYSTVTNESFSGSETYRFQVGAPAGLLSVSIRYRVQPTWFVGVGGGVFGGKLDDLRRGGRRESGSIDFSSGFITLETGGNF